MGQGHLAERSQAVAQGAIPKGRGFEPHRCHFCPVCGGPGWDLEFQFPCRVVEVSVQVSFGLGARSGIGLSIPKQGWFLRMSPLACGPGWELEFQFPCRVSVGSVHVPFVQEAGLGIGISIPMPGSRGGRRDGRRDGRRGGCKGGRMEPAPWQHHDNPDIIPA